MLTNLLLKSTKILLDEIDKLETELHFMKKEKNNDKL